MLNDKKKKSPIKIIFGLLMLWFTGQEYIHASRDLGTFSSLMIIGFFLGVILLFAWVIGSGFSPTKLVFKSLDFVKFFIISLVVFSISAFFTLASYAKPDNFKIVNGINIPMNRCIDGSRRMIPNKDERIDYCTCVAEKITANPTLKNKYKSELKKGHIFKVLTSIEKEGEFPALNLESCSAKLEMKWTDNIVNTMVLNCEKELEGTDFAQTNDTQIYCDCTISEYQKHPLSKVLADDFQESELGLSIDNNCTEKSAK
jgi:hypothetical protein